MAEPFDPNDRVTRNEHTPDHWPLALSLWVAFQQQLAQLILSVRRENAI